MKIRSVYLLLAFTQLFLLMATSHLKGQNGDLINNHSVKTSADYKTQSTSGDQEAYIQQLYSDKIEIPKEFLNGKEYESYYSRVKAKPLLFFEKKRSASIITKTRHYNNLSLQYDTFLDEVIYTDTSITLNFRFPQIALNKDIIDEFHLYFEDDSAIFKNYRETEASMLNLKEGFYEVVYENRCKFIIKHESKEYLREGRNNYRYSPQFYLSTGGKFSPYKNRKTFLKFFGDKSDDIKRYIKTTGIKIGNADKFQIVSILKFYDSLTVSGKLAE